MTSGSVEVRPYDEAVQACRRAAWPVIAFSMAINVLMLTTAIYMLQVYDRVLSSYRVETLLVLSLIAIIALLTLAGLEVVRARLLISLGDWIHARLAPVLLAVSVEKSARAPGAPGERGLRDLEQIRGFIAGPNVAPVLDAPWVPIFMVAIFVIHPWLGWVSLLGAAMLFLLAVVAETVSRDALGKAGGLQQMAHRQAEAAGRNAEAIQAMGMLADVARRWGDLQNYANNIQRVASERSSVVATAARFLRLALQIAVLGLGAYLVIAGDMRAGGMIAAMILMGRALAPVEQSIATWKAFVAFRGAAERMAGLIRGRAGRRHVMPMPRPRGRLSVKDVSLQIDPDGAPILSGVSFDLADGEVLGLIGPSAAGKTSLARVLTGVWKPTEGRVTLDGLDVAEWDSEDRGQHVGYLPQNIELFSGTVADNIGRFRASSREAWGEIVRAAEMADVHELAKALPKGYETQIGEGGAMLSGGQRQRIALARALFGNPALVVLDEPGANLDRDGEQALERAVRRLKANGVTVVVIAHRPEILTCVDKILLLRQGRVELFGPRLDVLASLAANPHAPVESAPATRIAAQDTRRIHVSVKREQEGEWP